MTPRRVRSSLRFFPTLALVAAASFVARPARAGDDSPAAPSFWSQRQRAWPATPPRDVHLFTVAGLGSCARVSDQVGGSGVCVEGAVGLDYPLWDRSRLHADLELGAGFMNHQTFGFRGLGEAAESGGGYGVVRGMVGYDVTHLFFLRVGGQLRITDSEKTATPGEQVVIDLGTRVTEHVFEVGLRGYLGCDGISTVTLPAPSTAVSHQKPAAGTSHALAFGAGLLFRFFIL